MLKLISRLIRLAVYYRISPPKTDISDFNEYSSEFSAIALHNRLNKALKRVWKNAHSSTITFQVDLVGKQPDIWAEQLWFGMTWGSGNDDRSFILKQTNPLQMLLVSGLTYRFSTPNKWIFEPDQAMNWTEPRMKQTFL